jgi:hypothetical protein
MSDIQVYQLIPPRMLLDVRDPLQRAILGNDLFVDQQERVFTVSPHGWIGYVDHGALWRQGNPGALPQTREEVLKAAEEFVDAVNARTEAFNTSTSAGLRSLLPDRNQRLFESCVLMMKPDRSGFDHWVCRYSIRVNAGTATAASVPVYGMSLELRIGVNGAVLGLRSQWRPMLRTVYADAHPYERFAFLLKNEEKPDDENPDAGKLLYLYDGAAGNQYYLAPYYYRTDEDHLQVSPASQYSLVVRIFEEDTFDGTRVVGKAYGGSGAYSFNWAYWNVDTAWRQEDSLVVLGEGDVSRERDETGTSIQSTLTLPRSYYTVMLHVTDQRSGAYGHQQQTIYSKPQSAPNGNV